MSVPVSLYPSGLIIYRCFASNAHKATKANPAQHSVLNSNGTARRIPFHVGVDLGK